MDFLACLSLPLAPDMLLIAQAEEPKAAAICVVTEAPEILMTNDRSYSREMIQSREFNMAAASYCGNQIDTENVDLEALLHTELDLPLESNFDEDSSSSDIVNVSLELLVCVHIVRE